MSDEYPTAIEEYRRVLDAARERTVKLSRLLHAVLDAGRPHSHLCDCDMCAAWLAVRKELRGE